MSLKSWYCSICQSSTPQRKASPGLRKTCVYSLFGEKTIEEMTEHMISVHKEKPPKGYDELKRKAKNKSKNNRRKRKKK